MYTSNPIQVVDFPTRIGNNKRKLIDNIFLDTTKYDKIKVKQFINDLTDHDTQKFSVWKTLTFHFRKKILKRELDNYKKNSVLKDESWDSVHNASNGNECLITFDVIFKIQ